MNLKIEICESTPAGVYVTHMRAKQRSDKRNSRFLIPRKTGEVSAADVLDLYLRQVKGDLGLYTGRLLWRGNGISFTKTPLEKNMVGEVPSDMATHLHINEPKKVYIP
ncbi:uncharacterized protein LOC111696931 isoform X2 [Eurytemora carolleeae]|uniref:uncharacterized protein LOC111696931 isoform X2 n=1 Tax=Eurytemora carolleeae TaxID=1294199 RepID=UPI000C784F0F|nr:uncharacterized protein LOC111696931 isoform X2 [Eurytemora carolleeae]|eukprot:XP_023322496.1 uncharacterized protein LOC111696931 isoform X2 [Eurytemora affinis]